MKVLVTGASGFLGTAVVKAAAQQGHEVVAFVRPTADVSRCEFSSSVQILRGDLRQGGTWRHELGTYDAVIHLAAALTGDLPTQFLGTVVATENLLCSLDLSSVRRFVHVSSFSVYDFANVSRYQELTERSCLERNTSERDAYTTCKTIQERLVGSTCSHAGTDYVVIRPGAIYGPGKHWDFGRALKLGRFDFIFSPRARLRLTYVENCADAIVRALEARVSSGSIYNIVDDDLPTHYGFWKRCRRAGALVGMPVPVPWLVVFFLGVAVRFINNCVFSGRARLPELLALRRQQARWRPLTYSNGKAKQELGWLPRVGLLEGVARSIADVRP